MFCLSFFKFTITCFKKKKKSFLQLHPHTDYILLKLKKYMLSGFKVMSPFLRQHNKLHI